MDMKEMVVTEKMDQKVVSIFRASSKASKEESVSLSQVMEKNKAVQERLESERLKANQKVLKSYRLKKK